MPVVSPPPPEPALIDLLTRAQNPRMAENTSNRKELDEAYHRRELHTSFTLFLQQGACLLLCVWGSGVGSERKDKLSLSLSSCRVLFLQ